MSHFSKIKTNITDFTALTKTLNQLGFNYKSFKSDLSDVSSKSYSEDQNIVVYQEGDISKQFPVFNFAWSGTEYILVADIQSWKVDVDFNFFLDRLFQQYAYNVVINTSSISGFSKVEEKLSSDGSIKITLNRWSNN